MKLLRRLTVRLASRPRRRRADGVDAGFRLSSALFLDWLFLVALMHASETRETMWHALALIGGLPLFAVNVYALLTLHALLVDRSWDSAQRMDISPPPPSNGVGPGRDSRTPAGDRRSCARRPRRLPPGLHRSR